MARQRDAVRAEAERYGVSIDYWTRLGEGEKRLYRTIAPLPKSKYEVDVPLHMMRGYLDDVQQKMESKGGRLELTPDFQRGHVWVEEQRVRFVESALAGRGSMSLVMNIPHFNSSQNDAGGGDIDAGCAQCIDGLQRLTAMLDFVEGRLKVFGSLTAASLEGSTFSVRRTFYKVRVFEFVYRRELLEYYLAINGGGTVHSDTELDRVRALLAAATT